MISVCIKKELAESSKTYTKIDSCLQTARTATKVQDRVKPEEQGLDSNSPTSFYTLEDKKLTLQFWQQNSLAEEKRPSISSGAKLHSFPVAASPAHGENGFVAVGKQRQNIIFDDGTYVTHVDFQLPMGLLL